MNKQNSIYEDLFAKLDLNKSQSKIYEFLMQNGSNTAGNISKATKIKRGLTYNALDELERKNLIYKNSKSKIIKFEVEHPGKLLELAEKKEKEAKDIKNNIEIILPSIIESFNLISDKPGIRYFEGYDSVKKAFDELLDINDGTEEILNFFGVSMYSDDKKLLKIGFDYVDRREMLKIRQKTIAVNYKNQISVLNKYIKENLDIRKLRYEESRLMQNSKYGLNADINIYKNKVIIISKNSEKVITIIIDNKEIANTLKSIFYLIWEK